MRRAFLSLYGLIVLSVISVGWGLDQLWQYYSPDVTVAQTDADAVILVASSVQSMSENQRNQYIQSLRKNIAWEVEVLSLDDFAQSRLLQRLASGEVVAVHNLKQRTLYKLVNSVSPEPFNVMGQQSFILKMSIPFRENTRAWMYDLLLLVFYGAIALVVFLWVWPLSRDLRRLEAQTRLVGRDQVPDPLHFAPTSTVYDLASAFNRMSQRIRDLLASHKEMTYAVSHELRTPLARMKFGLEIAGESSDLESVQKKLKGVRDDVSEMDDLVNQLLSYASFEQTDQNLDMQRGDLNCLLIQLIARCKQDKPESKVDFVVDRGSEPFVNTVSCEWHLMERALINLLQNAQRHAASLVLIELTVSQGFVVLKISDDGPGVPVEERDRIFQSFVRLSTDINAKSRGFGLGLAIVQRVVRWHGGSVELRDCELGGACFVVRWPM